MNNIGDDGDASDAIFIFCLFHTQVSVFPSGSTSRK